MVSEVPMSLSSQLSETVTNKRVHTVHRHQEHVFITHLTEIVLRDVPYVL